MAGAVTSVTHDVVSYNGKIVRGNGWAEGLELGSDRSPLRVEGAKGRSRGAVVSADYRKRFRGLGLLAEWLKLNRKRDHKGNRSKSAVRRFGCSSVFAARLHYVRKKREENRKRASRRAVTQVRRKAKELWARAQGNVYMLTLTYDPKSYVDDFGKVRRDLRNFFRRLNRKIGRSAGYIAVPERGKKGRRWHWHVLVDVHLDWREWERVWGQGHIWVSKVRNLTHAVRYVVKYVSKSFEDGVEMGRYRYFSSKGLAGWSVDYVVAREEFETWFRFRGSNEGYRVVGMLSSEEKGFRWWEAVVESMGGGSLDIMDKFVPRGCEDGDSVLIWCRENVSGEVSKCEEG